MDTSYAVSIWVRELSSRQILVISKNAPGLDHHSGHGHSQRIFNYSEILSSISASGKPVNAGNTAQTNQDPPALHS